MHCAYTMPNSILGTSNRVAGETHCQYLGAVDDVSVRRKGEQLVDVYARKVRSLSHNTISSVSL
jgi:hypothetical protein